MFKNFIYKIICKDENIKDTYVGSTYNIKRRQSLHKFRSKDSNYKLYDTIRLHGGFDNWSMIVVEEFETDNKEDKLIKEKQYIEILNANLNIRKPFQTDEERIQYRIKHNSTEDHKQYCRNYNKSDKFKAYQKEYYLKKKIEKNNVSNIINENN